jgi:uncharacterized lipoprotein YddW (UPF0748 family)
MNRRRGSCVTALLTLSAILCIVRPSPCQTAPDAATTAPQAEVRAVWASTLSPCMNSPEEIRELVAAVRKAHLNTIIAQVRHRGVVYYKSKHESRAPSIRGGAGFDPLAALLADAHNTSGGAARLAVHAWFNVFKLGSVDKNSTTGLGEARARFHEWLSLSPAGEVQDFLDPAIPEVQDHLIALVAECVRDYDVDGINLDFIRYPESEAGYHPRAIERFNRLAKRTGKPDPKDKEWNDFRRAQITAFVRRCAATAWSIRPDAMLSVDAIGFGGPRPNFADTAPYQQVHQDWAGWLREGDIDLVARMGYKRETNTTQALHFRGWARFSRELQGACPGRFVTVGIGGYLNPLDETLAQYRVARDLGLGTSLFSYHRPIVEADTTKEFGPASPFWAALARDIYPAFVPAPRPEWRKRVAMLAGVVRDAAGKPADGATISLKGTARSTTADGSGFFAITMLAPGGATISAPATSLDGRTVELKAGKVTMLK